MAASARTMSKRHRRGWAIVGEQELRDLWLGGRGLLLALAFSVLVSVIAYLTATNQALNFLEQRESVNLTLQVAIAMGSLLALVRRITAERGATVLLSTHLLAEVEQVCSRVLILNRGRLAAEGTVS